MKKIFLIATLLMLGAFSASAQVVDTEEQQKQQQALQQQQQLEQQQLLEQQQAEQQKLLEQQQAEQEKAAKAEQKAQEKEQARIEKEQAKAEAQAKKEAKQQRREELGRGMRFSIDPYLGIADQTRALQRTDIYNLEESYLLGAKVMAYYPISKKWDLAFGLGYRFTFSTFYNSVKPNSDNTDLELYPMMESYHHEAQLSYSAIELPIYLRNYNKGYHIGFNLGYVNTNFFNYNTLNADNTRTDDIADQEMNNMNKFHLNVVLGFDDHWFLFNTGVSLYFNLLPTYVEGTNGNNHLHEFGIIIQL